MVSGRVDMNSIKLVPRVWDPKYYPQLWQGFSPAAAGRVHLVALRLVAELEAENLKLNTRFMN